MASNEAPSGSVTSTGAGVSFAIAKRNQSRLKGKVVSHAGTGEGGGGGRSTQEPEKDYVFSFEEGSIHSSNPVPKKKEYVVPLIRKVIWRRETEGGAGGGATSDAIKTEEELSLDKEAAKAIISDLQNARSEGEEAEGGHVIPLLLQNKPPVPADATETGELADLSMRPDPSSAEDYEEMPIGEYGKAMLRGMGWKEGTGIGKNNKGMVAPVEFIPRPAKMGLGAVPKPQEKPAKKRPGRPDKKVVQGPYIGTDGRVKHMRYIGEEIPQQPIQGFRPGNSARVVSGPHVGLSGKIVSADEESGRVSLRLAINSQVIEFSQHRLELISKDDYTKPPVKQSTSTEYGLIKRKGESSKEPSSSKSNQKTKPEERDEEERSGEKREKMKSSAESDSHHSHHHKRAKRSKHSDRTESGRPSSGHLTIETSRGDHSTTETSEKRESSREKVWVAPNLRVRIVDTAFKRGRYYNSKVEIMDVVSGDQCVCRTADGILLEGVHQGMLETVVPKTQKAAVMIVRGKKHKWQVGRVLERDSENCKATVELVYSSQVLTFEYDDMCEFTGDVED